MFLNRSLRRRQKGVEALLDNGVALARSLFEAGTIEDLHVPAMIEDEALPLQNLRRKITDLRLVPITWAKNSCVYDRVSPSAPSPSFQHSSRGRCLKRNRAFSRRSDVAVSQLRAVNVGHGAIYKEAHKHLLILDGSPDKYMPR